MLYSTFISGAVVAMLQVLPVSAMPTTAPSGEAPVPGYGIQEITWELETESGATVNLTGTIQQVMRYAEENQILLKQNTNVSSSSSSSSSSSFSNMRPQNISTSDSDVYHVTAGEVLGCDLWNQSLARKDAIQDGITYLRGVVGKPANGPGPNNCGRVSCSWNAAIWWCNDNTVSKALGSYNYIADGAQFILNNCVGHPINVWYVGVQGSLSMPDGWRVVVTGDTC
ncbi:hypothetical protein QBC32DRAFT_379277 [Pseudoneurospora amorphoporcata]|uniref:Secreted protein n=1 Tax=Pseudoneurospora amorphoporcata TaxID=241081 RepID=A0AAN6NS05_9PEZI|nr:hypothetical protein QBC32DRAFT_379277 [Pseudoneurospora amorphoporcata]